MALERIENHVRRIGRGILPQDIKRSLWFHYMDAKRVIESRSFDMFNSIHLEINTDCNRSCSYCSNFIYPKKPEKMLPQLYNKIIDELEDANYRGRICFNYSSEPTLHPELPAIIKYARKVKRAKLYIYTNGDFLNRESFDQLKKSGADHFVITQHGENIPEPLSKMLHSLSLDEKNMLHSRL